MTRRFIAAAALLALVGTACFDDDRRVRIDDPSPVIAKAPERAVADARMRTHMAFRVFSADQTAVAVEGRGALDLARSTSSVRFDIPGSRGFRIVFTDRSSYFQASLSASTVGGGRGWVRVDHAVTVQSGQNPFSLSEPSGLIGALAGAQSAFVDQGPERRDGKELRHYIVMTDLAQAARRAPASLRDGVRVLRALIRKDLLPVEVWFDDSARLYGVSVDVPFGQQTFRATLRLTDHGDAPRIQVPPASDTTRLRTPEQVQQFFATFTPSG